jgi:hypothetical protein
MNLNTLDTPHLFALAAALGWASGLRLYAVVFLTGLAGALGWVDLPPGLQILQNRLVLGVAGVLVVTEFLADKVPLVDSVWDAVHTFIRIPAGAALAAGMLGADQGNYQDAAQVLAALLGGGLAATAHVAKATTRMAVNTSPEPFSNIGLSLLGDLSVPTMLWLAWQHPLALCAALTLTVLAMLALTVALWKLSRGVLQRFWAKLHPPSAAA